MKQKEILKRIAVKWRIANDCRKKAIEENTTMAKYYAGNMTAYEEIVALMLGKSWNEVFNIMINEEI